MNAWERRDFLRLAGLGAAALATPRAAFSKDRKKAPVDVPKSGKPAAPVAPGQRPNILFIMSDQHRWDALGCYGNTFIKTPNMDRLAAEGLRFNGMFSPWPLCGPARACLMSGQYPQANGAQFNGEMTPLHNPRLPRTLKENGYKTGVVGIIDFEPRQGVYHGYDAYIYKSQYDAWARAQGVKDSTAWQKEGGKHGGHHYGVLDIPAEHHFESWVTERTCQLLEQWKDQPFFISMGMRLPHPPYLVPSPYDKMYRPEDLKLSPAVRPNEGKVAYSARQLQEATACYYANISFVDACLGKVLNKLDELGLAKNTIVVYTTDHGNNLGHHGEYGKMTFYDDDARLPFIMRYPGQPQAGGVVEGLVEQVDVMPTLLDLCGVAVPQGVQGQSMVNLMHGREAGKQAVFGFAVTRRQMVRTKDWKLILTKRMEERLLFDLRHDPLEMNNLYGKPESAPITQQLKDRLLQWHLDLADRTVPNLFNDPDEAARWIQRYMDPVVTAAGWQPSAH